jgi:hypothetical protein
LSVMGAIDWGAVLLAACRKRGFVVVEPHRCRVTKCGIWSLYNHGRITRRPSPFLLHRNRRNGGSMPELPCGKLWYLSSCTAAFKRTLDTMATLLIWDTTSNAATSLGTNGRLSEN